VGIPKIRKQKADMKDAFPFFIPPFLTALQPDFMLLSAMHTAFHEISALAAVVSFTAQAVKQSKHTQ
jgi:hypothetical protein